MSSNDTIKKIINKIKKNKFTIFYDDHCSYCKLAIKLLKKNKLSFKGYNIDNIKGGLPEILSIFNNNNKWVS